MDEKELSCRMRDEAVSLGLCKKWTEEWGEADKHAMCRKFVDGLDFCIKHNWPSVEVIKSEFGNVIHEHGVYADEPIDIRGDETIVLNGHCTGNISVCDMAVADIHVRHSSDVTVKVKDYAYAHISVYDDATVTVWCEPTAKCFVYRYGGNANIESKKVIVRERKLKNYET